MLELQKPGADFIWEKGEPCLGKWKGILKISGEEVVFDHEGKGGEEEQEKRESGARASLEDSAEEHDFIRSERESIRSSGTTTAAAGGKTAVGDDDDDSDDGADAKGASADADVASSPSRIAPHR